MCGIHGGGGGEPIWVTAEKQGTRSATHFWPGSEAPIQGIQPTHWLAYNGSIPNPDRVQTVLQWLELPMAERPRFIMLYFNDVDYRGHRSGPESSELEAAVRHLDAMVGLLLEGLEARDLMKQVNLMIVSDHGMTEVSADRVVLLDDYIDLNDVVVVNWSPVLDLWPKPGKLDSVYAALKDAHPALKIYHKEDVPEHLHFKMHRRIPPIVGIMEEGWTCAERAAFEQNRMDYNGGNHGYDNYLPSMQGIFIAHGPAFRKGTVVPLFENIQLYNMMALVLQLDPAPNDGSFEAARAVMQSDVYQRSLQFVEPH